MSDIERIENVLHRPPGVKAPAGLAEKLKADIALPRATATAGAADFWAVFRRWFPGFATAALFLTCLVALGVQQRVLSGLQQEQKQLQSSASEVQRFADATRSAQEQARAHAAQLAQLRKDHAELQQLRGEVAQLLEQLQQLPVLRAEQQRLMAQAQAMVSASTTNDPFAVAQDKAQRVQCVSNMKQIGLAARMWANNHKDTMPSDFLAMQNELNSPKILVCPTETNRPAARTWSEFNGSSYVILSPGIPETRPEIVYAHCPIHNNVCLVDGSVQQLGPQHEVIKDETDHWILRIRK